MEKDTILLVEDDPDEVELALLGFRKISGDYDIQVATTGEDALDFLFSRGPHSGRAPERKPDLIILDVDLPKVSGFDVLEQLRQSEEYRTTPVVMLTTSDEKSDMLRAYGRGVNSYLCKPVNFDSFADLLQQTVDHWLHGDARVN